MEYNTSQEYLILPEYGRHIQKMVKYAVEIEDRTERNKIAQGIIQIMGQLNPHLRDVADFKHKLWDHLFIISEFKLDVDSPYPIPVKENFQTKPDRMKYPHEDIKYRHYGKTIERIIEKAVELEEGDAKNALIEMIANQMKKSYLTWNKDSVNDEVILQHLYEFSKGKLKLGENARLSQTSEILGRAMAKKKTMGGGGKKQGYRYGNGPRNNRNYRQNNQG